MQARRDKGLCYNCDEPYVYGHKCKRMQVYVISAEEEGASEEQRNAEEEQTELTVEPGISLHALTGYTPFQTLVLQGTSNNVPINILVDSGSTHNFVDPQTVKQVGCSLIPTNNLLVTVADESKVSSNAICPGFQWTMDGEEFYNMILEVQWMKQVGPVTLDMNHLTLAVHKNHKQVVLRARTRTNPSLQVIT